MYSTYVNPCMETCFARSFDSNEYSYVPQSPERYGGQSTSWSVWDPIEQNRRWRDINRENQIAYVENQYAINKRNRELAYQDNLASEKQEAQWNKELDVARNAAQLLQKAMVTGKSSLVLSYWKEYLAALKNIPAIKNLEQTQGDLSNEELAAKGLAYYSRFCVDAEGKPANFDADAMNLPSSLTQNFWSGLTFGQLYTNDNYSSIMKEVRGEKRNKADQYGSNIALGAGAALTGATTLGTAGALMNGVGNAKLESLVDDVARQVEAQKVLSGFDDVKDFKGLRDKLDNAIKELAAAKNAAPGGDHKALEDKVQELSKQVNSKLDEIVNDAQTTFDKAKIDKEKAEKALEKATSRVNDCNKQLETVQKRIETLNKQIEAAPSDENLKKQLSEATAKQGKLTTSLEKAQTTLNNSTKKYNTANSAFETAETSLKTVKEKVKNITTIRSSLEDITQKAAKAEAKLISKFKFESVGEKAVSKIKNGEEVGKVLSSLKHAKRFKSLGKVGALIGLVCGMTYGVYKASEA